MKSSIWIAILFAVVATLWIASGQFGDAADTPTGTPGQDAKATLPGVQFIISQEKGHRRELTINGHTEAERRVRVRAETDGRVIEIGAEKGKRVASGDVIARLALNDREERRAEARALVRQREVEFSASRQLAGKGFRSDTNLAQAQAQLDAARAALARIETDIANTIIRAPFDGVLNDRMVEVGNYVQAGDEVAQIVDTDPMLVVIEVPETHALSLELGDLAEVRFSTGETRTGVIRYIASVANSATRTFRVEAELDNKDGTIRDGLTAAVQLSLDSVPAHFITPAILTLDDSGQMGVKLLDEKNTVTFRPVRIIASESDGVWLAGLPPRARLIVVGQEFVAEGQKVEAVQSEAFASSYADGEAKK